MAPIKPVRIKGQAPSGRQTTGATVARTGPVKLTPRAERTQYGKAMPEYMEDLGHKPQASEVEYKFDAPAHALPAGWMWVWNRLNQPWERSFDGVPQTFQPFEFKPVTEEIAAFLYAHCIISYSDEGEAIRCLAFDKEDEGAWCVPLEDPTNVELIDRSVDDNPIQWGTGGEPTKAVVMKVPGNQAPVRHGGHGSARAAFSRAVRGKN